jgi:nicotinate-nucleotide pyrophosphorylase
VGVRIGGGTITVWFVRHDHDQDNHIDYAGGIVNAIKSVREFLHEKKLPLKVEIEARILQMSKRS